MNRNSAYLILIFLFSAACTELLVYLTLTKEIGFKINYWLINLPMTIVIAFIPCLLIDFIVCIFEKTHYKEFMGEIVDRLPEPTRIRIRNLNTNEIISIDVSKEEYYHSLKIGDDIRCEKTIGFISDRVHFQRKHPMKF